MTTEKQFPAIIAAGDCGAMVLFGDSPDLAVNNAAHAFDRAVSAAHWAGVVEITPAIRGVLIRFDPLAIDFKDLQARLEELLRSRDWLSGGPVSGRRLWELPVHYGEESGPDIASVATAMGCGEDEVIQRHCNGRLRVLMLGFAPGCAYLGYLPDVWDLPRLDYVKPEVPPGSISVAVRQTVLFATAIPTGWSTIGRTPFLSFSRHQEPYFFLAPGDEIGFFPVDAKQFETLSRAVAAGQSIVQPRDLP